MYKVFCDNNLLYSPEIDGYNIFNTKIENEVNKTGSFNFTIYPDHPRYDSLKKLKSIITVFDDSDIIFRGRILSDETGFYNEKKLICEGELAFLLDSIQRPHKASDVPTLQSLFALLIERHNNIVNESHQFTVGNVTVSGDYVPIDEYEYINTWDYITKKLIGVYGGYLQIRHENGVSYIDYVDELNNSCNQPIKFGKNLIDLKNQLKAENLATRVIPLGHKITRIDPSSGEEIETEERLTIADVNQGLDYLENLSAVDLFEKIEKEIIYDEITEATTLKEEGQKYLDEISSLTNDIDLTAIDLANVDKSFENFKIGQKILVDSPIHNIQDVLTVTKQSLDLFNPASNKITIGKSEKALTEQNYNDIQAVKSSVNVLSATSVTVPQVNNIVTSTCYTKTQSQSKFSQIYKTSNASGRDVISQALSALGLDAANANLLSVKIYDVQNKYYFGDLYIKNGSPVLTSTSGTLSVTASGDSLFVTNGIGPFNFILST